jgi:hypothetical protein
VKIYLSGVDNMPKSYTENEQKWKDLSDINWLNEYTKAWISFNAWYRNFFSNNTDEENKDYKTDRAIINEIKKSSNKKDSIIRLINDEGANGIKFRSYISELHSNLENTSIPKEEEKISFKNTIDFDSINNLNYEKNGIKYTIIYEKMKKEYNIILENIKKKDEFFNVKIKWDERNKLNSNKLTHIQLINIQSYINEMSPYVDLLNTKSSSLTIGNFKFVNDINLLSRCIIEILYQLRCVLFHGEIIPDKKTQKVYEPAYHILKMLIND